MLHVIKTTINRASLSENGKVETLGVGWGRRIILARPGIEPGQMHSMETFLITELLASHLCLCNDILTWLVLGTTK